MSYKKGDIVLIDFPFTDLNKSKKLAVVDSKYMGELKELFCSSIF